MPQRAIELILARQLASGLAVAVLLVDARADLLYINEPAEEIFGRRFDEIDSLPLAERGHVLAPRDRDGNPLPSSDLPGIVAIRTNRPVHASFWIEGLDGRQRATESTAIPLRGVDNTVVGAMVMIWLAEVPPPEELQPVGAVPLAVPVPDRTSGG
jgi:PAS domain-containing protein